MKSLTIELNINTLRKMLLNVLVESPNKNLIAKCVLDNIENGSGAVGLTNLFYALQGVQPEISDYDLKINESIMIKVDDLYHYDIDKEAMKKVGIILNGTIEAVIVGFESTKRDCIKIKYVYIDKKGKKGIRENNIYPEYVIKKVK